MDKGAYDRSPSDSGVSFESIDEWLTQSMKARKMLPNAPKKKDISSFKITFSQNKRRVNGNSLEVVNAASSNVNNETFEENLPFNDALSGITDLPDVFNDDRFQLESQENGNSVTNETNDFNDDDDNESVTSQISSKSIESSSWLLCRRNGQSTGFWNYEGIDNMLIISSKEKFFQNASLMKPEMMRYFLREKDSVFKDPNTFLTLKNVQSRFGQNKPKQKEDDLLSLHPSESWLAEIDEPPKSKTKTIITIPVSQSKIGKENDLKKNVLLKRKNTTDLNVPLVAARQVISLNENKPKTVTSTITTKTDAVVIESHKSYNDETIISSSSFSSSFSCPPRKVNVMSTCLDGEIAIHPAATKTFEEEASMKKKTCDLPIFNSEPVKICDSLPLNKQPMEVSACSSLNKQKVNITSSPVVKLYNSSINKQPVKVLNNQVIEPKPKELTIPELQSQNVFERSKSVSLTAVCKSTTEIRLPIRSSTTLKKTKSDSNIIKNSNSEGNNQKTCENIKTNDALEKNFSLSCKTSSESTSSTTSSITPVFSTDKSESLESLDDELIPLEHSTPPDNPQLLSRRSSNSSVDSFDPEVILQTSIISMTSLESFSPNTSQEDKTETPLLQSLLDLPFVKQEEYKNDDIKQYFYQLCPFFGKCRIVMCTKIHDLKYDLFISENHDSQVQFWEAMVTKYIRRNMNLLIELMIVFPRALAESQNEELLLTMILDTLSLPLFDHTQAIRNIIFALTQASDMDVPYEEVIIKIINKYDKCSQLPHLCDIILCIIVERYNFLKYWTAMDAIFQRLILIDGHAVDNEIAVKIIEACVNQTEPYLICPNEVFTKLLTPRLVNAEKISVSLMFQLKNLSQDYEARNREVVNSDAQNKEVVNVVPQTGGVVNVAPPRREVVTPQIREVVNVTPQNREVVNFAPQTAGVVNFSPQNREVVNVTSHTREVVNVPLPTREVVNFAPQTRELVTPQIREVVNITPQPRELVTFEPQNNQVPANIEVESEDEQMTDTISIAEAMSICDEIEESQTIYENSIDSKSLKEVFMERTDIETMSIFFSERCSQEFLEPVVTSVIKMIKEVDPNEFHLYIKFLHESFANCLDMNDDLQLRNLIMTLVANLLPVLRSNCKTGKNLVLETAELIYLLKDDIATFVHTQLFDNTVFEDPLIFYTFKRLVYPSLNEYACKYYTLAMQVLNLPEFIYPDKSNVEEYKKFCDVIRIFFDRLYKSKMFAECKDLIVLLVLKKDFDVSGLHREKAWDIFDYYNVYVDSMLPVWSSGKSDINVDAEESIYLFYPHLHLYNIRNVLILLYRSKKRNINRLIELFDSCNVFYKQMKSHIYCSQMLSLPEICMQIYIFYYKQLVSNCPPKEVPFIYGPCKQENIIPLKGVVGDEMQLPIQDRVKMAFSTHDFMLPHVLNINNFFNRIPADVSKIYMEHIRRNNPVNLV